jgi:hypothetical protein
MDGPVRIAELQIDYHRNNFDSSVTTSVALDAINLTADNASVFLDIAGSHRTSASSGRQGRHISL